MILKLGTRRSLLAWAQSSWVAREVEKHNPGITVELVGIDTQGDKILDKPLSQIDGKEFFTAELDHALLDSRVDFTVHSMKDLALDRPPMIQLAAVPERELQHDVIIFHESVIDRLKQGKEIRIGTSSPRRLTLIPSFLKKALPQFGNTPQIKFVEIRGNVNTRLSRVHELEGSEKKLDGVVLAFAGLERLSHDQKAAIELWKLMERTRFMVLPIRENPTAPAQGALAIEVRKENTSVLSYIQKLHHEATLAGVQKEREILQEWGGGCHQKLGANFIPNPQGGKLFIRGEKPSGEWVSEIRNFAKQTQTPDQFTKIDASDVFEFQRRELPAAELQTLKSSPLCFIAHSRALEFFPEFESVFASKRIWVSGSKSWFKLAEKGIWVEGSVESKGFDHFKTFQAKTLLRIPQEITFLTHVESEIEDPTTTRIATYTHQFREISQKITQATHLFWGSSLPFSTVWSMLKTPEKQKEFAQKTHASGMGKTAAKIRSYGIEPIIFDHDEQVRTER